MKRLLIIRHAKSSWANTRLSDFDRPLNDRGFRDAPRVGRELLERGERFDLMLSSPAKRALTTAQLIAEAMGYDKDFVTTDKQLYLASYKRIFSCVTAAPNSVNRLAIFAHNPGMEQLAELLSGGKITRFPTCAVCATQFAIDAWEGLSNNPAAIRFDYDLYPRELSE